MNRPSIDDSQVLHVAHLARLALTGDELQQMSRELSTLIEYVNRLGEVNTDSVPPTDHPFDAANVLRDDETAPSIGAAAALSNAPKQSDGCFQVPRVLDQGETA